MNIYIMVSLTKLRCWAPSCRTTTTCLQLSVVSVSSLDFVFSLATGLEQTLSTTMSSELQRKLARQRRIYTHEEAQRDSDKKKHRKKTTTTTTSETVSTTNPAIPSNSGETTATKKRVSLFEDDSSDDDDDLFNSSSNDSSTTNKANVPDRSNLLAITRSASLFEDSDSDDENSDAGDGLLFADDDDDDTPYSASSNKQSKPTRHSSSSSLNKDNESDLVDYDVKELDNELALLEQQQKKPTLTFDDVPDHLAASDRSRGRSNTKDADAILDEALEVPVVAKTKSNTSWLDSGTSSGSSNKTASSVRKKKHGGTNSSPRKGSANKAELIGWVSDDGLAELKQLLNDDADVSTCYISTLQLGAHFVCLCIRLC